MSRRACVLLLAMSCGGHTAKVTDASSSIYVRSDTDRTTIVAPTLTVAGAVDHTTAAATYSVDAWTGASVDVITAATQPIRENRHEVEGTLSQQLGTLTLSTTYRFSYERDYLSHGLTLGARKDFANKNTTLALDLLGSADTVGRSGDPSFSEPVHTLGARLTLAQVIDRNTIAELGWQTTFIDGLQSSPYRYVAIGDLGTCSSNAPYCIPERVPSKRLRQAATLRGRHAFGHSVSVGLDYRFYFDSWGIMSHAVQPDLAWRVTDSQTLSVRYRYATQSEASFYQPRYYNVAMTDGYVTRDRKLSALVDNEVGAQYLIRHENDDGDRIVTWGLRSTLSRADYLAYVGLDHVWALEVTALLGVELP
ncbi:hypothetical protein BH11MYX2_BH11MYX2_37630 [soil metagenome]